MPGPDPSRRDIARHFVETKHDRRSRRPGHAPVGVHLDRVSFGVGDRRGSRIRIDTHAGERITGEDGPVGVSGGWDTPSIFPMLRATALHGRVFDETTAKPGLNRVTLLGETPVGVDGMPSTSIEGDPIEPV